MSPRTIWGEVFWILLKGFRPLCNVTKSFELVVVSVLYPHPHFIFIVIMIMIVIIIITFLLLKLFLLFLLLFEFLSRAVYCSYEVSLPFDCVSFNFLFCHKLIHATTIWFWRTTSILLFGQHLIMVTWWQGT